jgi:hypothetical protein
VNWIEVSKSEVDFNLLGYVTLRVEYIWDENLNDWIGIWKGETSYNEFGDNISDIYYEWNTVLNDWYVFRGNQWERTYNASDRETSTIHYKWSHDSNDWSYSSKFDMFYNEEGNIVIKVYNEWDLENNDWELIYKTFYSYRLGYVTEIPENEFKEINIYPNPATSYLRIDGLTNPLYVSIYSLQGILVFQETAFNELLDISRLPQGVYIIVLHNDNKYALSGKLIKK